MNKLKYLKYLLVAAVVMFAACSDDDNGGITPPVEEKSPLARKEMRAVWVTTAWGLDWPQSDYTTASQKQQYTDYLDKFVELNFNTVIFQIKPMGDAFYNSSYEPWSKYITNVRGQDPGYDVLQFLIDETHARGMEFHAWMNPYRIATKAAGDTYPTLDASIPAEMVVDHQLIRIYNPALPSVQQRLADIVGDVLDKYDVDGIHFDDYFYPDPTAAGTMVSDAADYEAHGTGYATIQDFRRANVDKAIKGVHDVIVSKKPGVLFSVSPAASDTYNYGTLYADVQKWCKEGWIDIVMPQLYQHTESASSNFKERVHWWPQFSYKAEPVIGYGFYRFGDGTSGGRFQILDELNLQFARAALEPKVKGSAIYRAKSLLDNRIGITDRLKDIYKYPAVIPFMGRATVPAPAVATGVTLSGTTLSWTAPGTGFRSVVYCFQYITNTAGEITGTADVATVVAVTTAITVPITLKGEYCVTILNRDNTESEMSNKIEYK